VFISHRLLTVFLICVHFSCIFHFSNLLLHYLKHHCYCFPCFKRVSYIRILISMKFWLDSPAIESQLRRNFSCHPDFPRGPSSPVYYGYRIFPWCKAAGAKFLSTTILSTEDLNLLMLLLHFFSVPAISMSRGDQLYTTFCRVS
jgi:hypothetical protein